MPKVRITLDGWRCTRCDHEWVPRHYYRESGEMVPPKVCPNCKSPYWDVEPKRRRQPAPEGGQG